MDEIEVIQADREAAAAFFRDERTPLSVKFTLGHDPSPLLDAIARVRIAAEQRGAERMQEAVLPEVQTDRTIEKHGAHCCCATCELNIAEDGIRALDPAKIGTGHE